jgi:hypothetical protein
MGDELAGLPLCCLFACSGAILHLWSQDKSEEQVGANSVMIDHWIHRKMLQHSPFFSPLPHTPVFSDEDLKFFPCLFAHFLMHVVIVKMRNEIPVQLLKQLI